MKLGQKMRDKVTGFEGIATGRAEFLTGCIQWIIRPQVDKDGKMQDSQWVDEGRLEVIDEKVIDTTPAAAPVSAAKGGPQDIPARSIG